MEHRSDFLESAVGGIPPVLRGIGTLTQGTHVPPDTNGQKVHGLGVALAALVRISDLAKEAAKAYGIYRHPDQTQPGVNSWSVVTNTIGAVGDVMNGVGTSGLIRDPHWARFFQGGGALFSAAGSFATPFAKLQQQPYQPQVLPRHNVRTPAEQLRDLPNRPEQRQGEVDTRTAPTPPTRQPPGQPVAALLPASEGLLHQRRANRNEESGSSGHSPVAGYSNVRSVNKARGR
ncbi:hypothetical protein [Streptomyces sp. CoH17]|uniref:hypothetical protein n=1 Tax=Streptomyces sp. CoH17 TaxID=2992806 RepID=UPI00226E2BAC|nr:hypothetical protein [Streptomyces sp. CoH17]